MWPKPHQQPDWTGVKPSAGIKAKTADPVQSSADVARKGRRRPILLVQESVQLATKGSHQQLIKTAITLNRAITESDACG